MTTLNKSFRKETSTSLIWHKLFVKIILKIIGIKVNLNTGQLKYLRPKLRCQCKSLCVLRHGSTEAVNKQEFMSDFSNNSHLTAEGRKCIMSVAKEIDKHRFDIILFGSIPRVKESAKILIKNLKFPIECMEVGYIRGIDNGIWGGFKLTELDRENKEIYCSREIKHNIFAKAQDADSWADVLLRCIKIIVFLNVKFKSKKVLIVSQGSIIQGLKIVLGLFDKPFEDTSNEDLYGLNNTKQNRETYGNLTWIKSRRPAE